MHHLALFRDDLEAWKYGVETPNRVMPIITSVQKSPLNAISVHTRLSHPCILAASSCFCARLASPGLFAPACPGGGETRPTCDGGIGGLFAVISSSSMDCMTFSSAQGHCVPGATKLPSSLSFFGDGGLPSIRLGSMTWSGVMASVNPSYLLWYSMEDALGVVVDGNEAH